MKTPLSLRNRRILQKRKNKKINKINQLYLTRVTPNNLGLTSLWPSSSGSNWNLELLVFEGKLGKLEYPGKNLSEQGREPPTNPHMTPAPGARAKLVGGERSHHCAIPVPLKMVH